MTEEVKNEGGNDVPHETPAEDQARKMGWVPKEEFKGDESNWVSAEKFVERGENHIGLLKKKLENSDKKIAEMHETLKQFGDHHKKTLAAEQKRHEKMVKDLKKQQREAVELGDTNEYDRLEQEIADAEEMAPAEKEKASKKDEIPNEVTQFIDRNPWFNSDMELNAAAQAMHTALLSSQPGMSLDDNLKETEKRIQQMFPEKFGKKSRQPSPVEGATNGSGSGGKGSGYKDLPPEAKAACDRFVSQGMMTKDQYISEYYAYNE